MIGPIVTATESTGGETATLWTAIGTLAAAVASAIGLYAKNRWGNSSAGPESRPPTPPPTPPAPPTVVTQTADERLDYAEQLVGELQDSRNQLRIELGQANRRMAQQDDLIRQLQQVIASLTSGRGH